MNSETTGVLTPTEMTRNVNEDVDNRLIQIGRRADDLVILWESGARTSDVLASITVLHDEILQVKRRVLAESAQHKVSPVSKSRSFSESLGRHKALIGLSL